MASADGRVGLACLLLLPFAAPAGVPGAEWMSACAMVSMPAAPAPARDAVAGTPAVAPAAAVDAGMASIGGSASALVQDVPPPETVPVEYAMPPGDGDPKFFLWTDNSISVLPYGTGFAVDPEDQSTFTFEHAHASRIGDMFLFVDWNNFHGEPATDTTWYGEIGPRLSFGKITGKDLSHTFFRRSLFEIKDVLLALQYERGEDADVAEAALVGLGLDLDVREAGLLGRLGKFNYVQLNFYGRAELTETADSGINDMQITMVAAYPFEIGNQKFLVDGYFDWVLGLGDEVWSYHLNPQVTWDVGAAAWNVPGKVFMGVEVDLWWNKYQIPDSPSFDTDQAAVSVLLKYHF